MRRLIQVLVFAAATAAVWAPFPASAEGYVSPWAGVNFANDPGDGRNSFGVSAGGMGGGAFGAEFDFGYSPNFFDEDSVFGKNNVLTAMGNLIIGIPFGGQRGAGLRPYVTGGVGLIRTDFDGLFEGEGSSSNDFGFNLGGGVMGFFSDHVGLRGDLRYFRTLESGLDEDDNLLPDFDLGNFDFWRASIGIVIR